MVVLSIVCMYSCVKNVAKAKISVSLDVEVILWVDKQVRKGVFESRSQGIEQIVMQKMKEAK